MLVIRELEDLVGQSDEEKRVKLQLGSRIIAFAPHTPLGYVFIEVRDVIGSCFSCMSLVVRPSDRLHSLFVHQLLTPSRRRRPVPERRLSLLYTPGLPTHSSCAHVTLS